MDSLFTILYYFNMPQETDSRRENREAWPPDAASITINAAGRYNCAPDWTWDTAAHRWTDTDLWAVVGGEGELETPEGRFSLSRGDVFFLRGGERYVGSTVPHNPLRVIAVHFDVHSGTALSGAPTAPAPRLQRFVAPMDFLNTLLERSATDFQLRRYRGARVWFSASLAEIRRVEEEASAAHSEEPTEKVRAIVRMIRENPGERHRVSVLASAAGWSHQHLIRIFRRETGRTPGQFIAETKIEAAKAALRFSSAPIKQIARELGYRDEYFFSRRFRQVTGMAPGRFRTGR